MEDNGEIKVSTIFKLKTTQLLNYFTKNYYTEN